MYYTTHHSQKSRVHCMENSSSAHIRVLHAVPDAPNVDVYANDELIANNLAFGESTSYLPVSDGTYEVSLYVAGSTNSAVLTNMLTVYTHSVITVAAVGKLSNIGFLAIPDSNITFEPNNPMIRFAHLSPNAPAVDITLPDETVLFSNISFKEVTSYLSVSPSNYTLQVNVAGTSTIALTVPDVTLESNKIYTVYAIGLVDESPELTALLLEDYI